MGKDTLFSDTATFRLVRSRGGGQGVWLRNNVLYYITTENEHQTRLK